MGICAPPRPPPTGPALPPSPPTPLQFTCCCPKFCFLGLPFQSRAGQELALFKGCGENWGGGEGGICFFLLNQC